MSRCSALVRLAAVAALLLMATLLTAGSAAAQTIVAGPFHNPTNGSTYYVPQATNNWFQAESWAVALGGHLATDNDPAEHTYINSTIAPAVGEGMPVWIGLNDQAVENHFVWVSGESTPVWTVQMNPPTGSIYPWRNSGEPN